MQKNIVHEKRLESHRLIEKYMLSSSQKEKQDIRKQIHDIWDQVRLLVLEEKLTK
jgi:nitrogen-specific signal transduction histidine kinase